MHNPPETRISIITVSLNNRSGLEKTIRSVLSQRKVSIEYIVVDGGSGDGSLDIIKTYSRNIAAWVSEPDHGPYDAMNKGIALATGEWIIFLNAGDIFRGPDCLFSIIPLLRHDGIDAVYTDSMADYGNFKVYRRARPIEELWKGMIFSHQALLIKASILEKEKFDLNYPKIADYDIILRVLKDPKRVKYEPILLVICDAFGISNKGQSSILLEYYRRAKQTFSLGFGRKLHYLGMSVLLITIDLLKMILPRRLYMFMIRLLRRRNNSQGKIGKR